MDIRFRSSAFSAGGCGIRRDAECFHLALLIFRNSPTFSSIHLRKLASLQGPGIWSTSLETRSVVCLSEMCHHHLGGVHQSRRSNTICGRSGFKLYQVNNIDAPVFSLLNCFFVDVQGGYFRQVLYLTFLSFLPEVISNPHFTTVMVDLITIVHTLHL
jgi:hypothetical protein